MAFTAVQDSLVDGMEGLAPVELLRRQYLQCLDPNSLTLPKPELLRLPETQSRIYSSMFDEKRLQFAPPERYRFRVLKRVVGALEEAIEDPDEDVGYSVILQSFAIRFHFLGSPIFIGSSL